MRVPGSALAAASLLFATTAPAVEVTVKNDSLTDFGAAVVVAGFVANEKAAAWLTSPCAGNVRAAQVFWRSPSGMTGEQFGRSITIARSGTFPNPGAVQQTILGPVMTDGNDINEFRFLDENNTIPVNVPVVMGETFVVAFEFDQATGAGDASVVRDIDGCQAGRNGLHADIAGTLLWFSACSLGVAGDWVIRAVVDCGIAPASADLAIAKTAASPFYVPGGLVDYSIAVSNAGPGAAIGASVTDTFPSTLGNVSWNCTAASGGTCPAPPTGTGNISALVNLPAGGSVTFAATALVSPTATGGIVNSAGAFPPGGTSDPNTANNLSAATINLQADPVFDDGFE